MASTIPTLVAPSSRSWLGVAREAVTGTPVTPTNTIPLNKSEYEPEDMPKFLEDIAIRGSMSQRFADVLGVEDASFSYGGPFFGDVWGFFLDNVFGDLSTTGTTPLNGTTTAQALVVGGTVTTIHTATGYANSGVVQIDSGGISEVVVLNASGGVSGTTLTFSNYPLRFAHGSGATVNTVSGPYTHTFAVLNQNAGVGGTNGAQPPTHTATDFTNLTTTVGARSYPSLCVGQLDLTGNSEGLLMGKVTGNSWQSSPASSTPTNSTTFTVPLPAWNTTISVGGTAVTSIGEYAVSIKRELQVYWTETGAQNPYIIARGTLDSSGSLKFTVPSNEDPLNLMLLNTQPTVVITTTNGQAGTNLLSLTITTHGADFIKSKPNRSGVLIGYDNEFRTHANTTDVGGSAGLGQMTVQLIDNTPSF